MYWTVGIYNKCTRTDTSTATAMTIKLAGVVYLKGLDSSVVEFHQMHLFTSGIKERQHYSDVTGIMRDTAQQIVKNCSATSSAPSWLQGMDRKSSSFRFESNCIRPLNKRATLNQSWAGRYLGVPCSESGWTGTERWRRERGQLPPSGWSVASLWHSSRCLVSAGKEQDTGRVSEKLQA